MIHKQQLHALYGLKWNPFLPEIPTDALVKDDATKRFCWRVEQSVLEGGFVLVTGDAGSGKSVTMRHLAAHLGEINELTVRTLTRPQSHIRDFYREMAEMFDVPIKGNNRFGSFASLRAAWQSHIKASLFRPVLLIDEAQEVPDDVLNELRLLSSVDLDSKSILAVVLAGDSRLPNKLRQSMLLPLESRIRTRHHLDKRPQSELMEILNATLAHAGAPDLMNSAAIQAVAEHAMGNLRAMMLMSNELLTVAAEKKQRQIDEDLFLEIFKSSLKKKKTLK